MSYESPALRFDNPAVVESFVSARDLLVAQFPDYTFLDKSRPGCTMLNVLIGRAEGDYSYAAATSNWSQADAEIVMPKDGVYASNPARFTVERHCFGESGNTQVLTETEEEFYIEHRGHCGIPSTLHTKQRQKYSVTEKNKETGKLSKSLHAHENWDDVREVCQLEAFFAKALAAIALK